MVRSKCLFSSGVAVFFATTLWLRADPAPDGYLPNVGPVSLRFLAPAKPFKSMVIPASSAEPAKESEGPAEENSSIPLPSPKDDTNQTPPAAIELEHLANTNSLVEPAPDSEAQTKPDSAQEPEATISPQMLLKFFNKPPVFVAPSAAPVEFNAPQPAAPSSKATYSISP